MILLHDTNVELSRNLLATIPEGVEVVEGSHAYPVSAYPSVVVDVPTKIVKQMSFDEDSNFVGIKDVEIVTHQDILRCPISWEAVSEYVEYIKGTS